MILRIHKEMFDKLIMANIGNHFDTASNDRKNRFEKFGSNKNLDRFKCLRNCPPTPPLNQHFSLSKKLVLMVA